MLDLKALSFTVEEYRRRVSKVQTEIGRLGLDALIVHICADVCYLTGFQSIGSYGYGHYAAIVLPEGDPILFGSDFEMHNALINAWLEDCVSYPVMADPIKALAQLLTGNGLADKRLGIEQIHHSLTAREYRQLRELLPQATFVDASEVVETAMQIKSPAEIEVMRRAANLSSAGMLAAIECAAEGRTDNDVAAAAYQTVISNGGEYFSLQPIVTVGERSGVPHTTFRRTTLQRGGTMFIEVSACYERYSAPILRTVSIDKPSARVQRAVDACLTSVNTLIEQIRPGVRGCDMARRAGDALRAIEPNLVWHGIYGYSVGLTFPPMCSDCPNADITESSEIELQSGMIFHCSTSLRNVGQYGATMSETVLVTDRGCEVLTQVPRDLYVK